MHFNQQLVTHSKHFFAKLSGDCKEFDPEMLFCTSISHLLDDIWIFKL